METTIRQSYPHGKSPSIRLTDGSGLEVDVHPAGQGVSDDQRRRCQVVGSHVGVHPALEVPVTRQDSAADQVTLQTWAGQAEFDRGLVVSNRPDHHIVHTLSGNL